MPCTCNNIKAGTYENQIWVHAPAHMPKDNGYCLDRCVAEEVMQLWMKGITTNGCCCGHGYLPAYIGVSESDAPIMVNMGYEYLVDPSCKWPFTFKPKSI